MNITERHSLIRQRFDRRANRYLRNPFTHWVGRSELTALRNMIPAPAQPGESRALDFGCGTGRATALLVELGYKVTGFDLSIGMLDQARAILGNHPDVLLTSDPQALQGSWPLIVSLGVLDYYPDSASLWQEWRRLSPPGGLLLVTAPNAHSPLAWFYAVVSHFTCQAYTTTLDALTHPAQTAGFTVTAVKFAFPQRWWGHTIVLGFQQRTP